MRYTANDAGRLVADMQAMEDGQYAELVAMDEADAFAGIKADGPLEYPSEGYGSDGEDCELPSFRDFKDGLADAFAGLL